jgi:hypothetical protein
MANKKNIVGILALMLVFVGVGTVSAQTVVADLGDVRIYYYGAGYFGVESDRVGQCLPLNFRSSGGWVEIACSSETVRVASGAIGSGVNKVVAAAFAPYVSPVYSSLAGEIAGRVASWASRQGIDYLCN